MNLFTIDGLSFNKEDFLDNINEYEDIIAIIEELQENLKYDEIECVGENECCNKTKKNYIVEIQGFINQNDEFITMEEAKENNQLNSGVMDLFVIRLYKCVDCGKWIIDILEQQLIKHISKKVIKLFHISLMIVKNVIIANMEMKISVNIMPTVISSIIQKACQDTVDLVNLSLQKQMICLYMQKIHHLKKWHLQSR